MELEYLPFLKMRTLKLVLNSARTWLKKCNHENNIKFTIKIYILNILFCLPAARIINMYATYPASTEFWPIRLCTPL